MDGIACREVSSGEELGGAGDDAVDDRGVEERGSVAELVVLAAGHLAEDAAHDLARTRFGQARRELHAVWAGDVANLGVDLDADFLAQCRDASGVAGQGAVFEDHISVDRLTLDGVRVANDGALGHGRMRIDGVLNLGGAKAVTAHVDHVVDAADDAEHAVGVAPGPVAGEVLAFEGTEVDVAAPLVVAIGGADHGRPRAIDAEVALGLPFQDVAVAVHQHGADAGQGIPGMGRLHGAVRSEAADEDPAGLGLPPGIDQRTTAAANRVVVPLPSLLVDGLSHRSDDLERRQVVALCEAGLASHEGADGGGCGVELVDFELLAHLPESGGRRGCGHALKHDRGRPTEQRAVHDVAVAGDPADVGRAPIDVAGLILEHVGEAVAGIHHVAPASVDHPLGLARAARGVEDEEQVLGVHGLGRAISGHLGQRLVKPHITAAVPLDVFAGVADNQVGGDRWAFGEGLVHDGFEGEPFGAALHAVAGDHAHGSGVLDAVGQAPRREAGKDHAVHRADAGAGEHSNGQFRHHRQVKRHAVALLYPARLEHIGKAADPVVQLCIGDGHGVV